MESNELSQHYKELKERKAVKKPRKSYSGPRELIYIVSGKVMERTPGAYGLLVTMKVKKERSGQYRDGELKIAPVGMYE